MIYNGTVLEQEFELWLQGFRARAIRAKVSARTLKLCAGHVHPDPRIHEKQSAQAEFTLNITQYLDRAVTDARIRKGRAKFRQTRELLLGLSADYKVDAQVILAIWGIETNYGATRGDWSVLTSLATLAHAGHRASFFEDELIAALRIVETGDIAPAAMLGSWAGAMGHGQFMPSSFQTFAVDHNKDGRRDIWGDDPEDGVASIANYLSHHGWDMDRPSSTEISLPDGFDYALADRNNRLPMADWAAMGVLSVSGASMPDYGLCSVVLPSGANGPAFMTFGNFEVILTYNRAEAYGLAVGHLADRLQGDKPIQVKCPVGLVVLKRDETKELQERLTAAGFDTIGTDGFSGPNTAKALRAYQVARGIVADGFGSGAMLDHLRAEPV